MASANHQQISTLLAFGSALGTVRLAYLTVAVFVAAVPVAHAIGLGTPSATPVIGQPLLIDIPLRVTEDEVLPAADCVRMSASGESADGQFFPRKARVVIEGGKKPRVRIVSTEAITEPLIEFRLSLGCENVLERDFLLLPDAPGTVKGEPAKSPPSSPALADHPGPAVVAATRRLVSDSNLNTLAWARYPASQATRHEYRRLMVLANPDLFAGAVRAGAVPLAAGTVLAVPPNLPPAESRTVAMVAGIPERAVTSSATTRLTQPDRLVIGGSAAGTVGAASPLTRRELASAVDRMERMLEEQGHTEHQMIDNLKNINSAFIDVSNLVRTIEVQQQQLEIAQKALQFKIDSRSEPRAFGMLELMGMILAGGATGASLIMLHHRMHVQRVVARQVSDPADEPAKWVARWRRQAAVNLDFA